jgi:chromosome segregation protein
VFLRSLTLKGFKSFAEPTTLELEPGLTVVVGPNGSGKSNIVDAVAWVLGAQGPRTVRSSRMEDVIFAGNGRRPPLGRAEVTLTIDNSSGLLPIAFTEVTITRTLFRSSGESEYAINGVPCRLLDIQELLSDTGVGRQQHVIVSQGNLDQVLDVRPEDRRLIVEEAAGILKYRRRKDKAGRRLEATEAHLVRLTDLLREQRRQMRPLERQAEAARRHDELAAELRALRLYLAGRELASLTARAEAAARDCTRLAAEEASAGNETRRLDQEVGALEAQLGQVEATSLDATIARLEALRERARGIGAVLAEKARALAAELAAAEGGDETLLRLEAEAGVLTGELAEVDELAAGLAAARAAQAGDQAELTERRGLLAQWEAAEQATRRAAETRGELAALRAAGERGRAELADLEQKASAAGARERERAEVLAVGRVALADAEQHRGQVAARLETASRRRSEAEAALAEAVRATAAAERYRDEMRARVEALTLATGAPPVAPEPPPGLLGPLLELVEIEPGWEAAVEAGLGEALTALVVDGVDVARSLLDAGAAGAVLVAGGHEPPPSTPLPGPPLRPRVRSARADVGALLDRLLASAVAFPDEWEAAVELALAHPHLVIVTRRGDRFGPTGWRIAGRGASVAAALADARRRAEQAEAETKVRLAEEQAQRRAVEGAVVAWQAEEQSLAQAEEAVARRRSYVARLDADHRAAAAEAAAVSNHLAARAQQLAEEDERGQALEKRLTGLAAYPGGGAPLLTADLQSERLWVAEQSQALAARAAQLAAQDEALQHRRTDLARRLQSVESQLLAARARRSALEARAARTGLDLTRTRRLLAAVELAAGRIDGHLADLARRRERRAAVVKAMVTRLEEARRRRGQAERRLEEARAHGRKAELDEAEARMRREAAVEALRRELDSDLDAAVAADCPPLPAGYSPSSRARELERELRLLGPVNPLAVEELAALEERHAFLTAQLEDVKASRRELAKVIRSVEAEMTQLLAAAYADVAENFAALFETLFPGGEGRLRLSNPDQILEAGIEIDARPGGKSARKLSLLSGGERSLCALAFLFAVFRSRPSPFYLLYEVEAALDDVNLHRFLRLLDEFRSDVQLLVVTHQKRTMEAADCLYGVTMQPGGTSRVLSERVRTVAPAS